MDPAIFRRRVSISRATADELASLYEWISARLTPPYAPLRVCERMRQAHSDNQWLVRSASTSTVMGYCAMLMLNREGLAALLSGRFNAQDPDDLHIAHERDDVSGILMWGFIVPGLAVAAIGLISEFLRSPKYRSVPLYGHANTPKGEKIMRNLGFQLIAPQAPQKLFEYHRLYFPNAVINKNNKLSLSGVKDAN